MEPVQDKHPEGKRTGGAEQAGSPTAPPALPYQPGVEPGRIDVTGIIPEGIRIDPDLTEGHPGYEESGDSEIIPAERLAGGGPAADKEPNP